MVFGILVCFRVLGILIGSAAGSAKARRHAGHAPEHDMHMMMEMMNDDLRRLSGDKLEEKFLTDMIAHHEGAIEMAEILKTGTKRPELQKLADDIIAAQNKEVWMMQAWLGEWFK